MVRFDTQVVEGFAQTVVVGGFVVDHVGGVTSGLCSVRHSSDVVERGESNRVRDIGQRCAIPELSRRQLDSGVHPGDPAAGFRILGGGESQIYPSLDNVIKYVLSESSCPAKEQVVLQRLGLELEACDNTEVVTATAQ